MTWLIAWAWLKGRAVALFGVVGRHPWQFACIALLCLSLWFLHGRTDARADLADRIAAEKAATGAQKRVNQAATKHYEDAANAADAQHTDMVAEAFDSTARYISEHRVRPEGGTCKNPAPAASEDTSVPAEVPSGVVVGEADVHACADLYAYSVSAHDWAQSLAMPENLLPDQ